MTRTDTHRPSAIVVADYDFVAYDYYGSGIDAMALAGERQAFRLHRERTGGTFSQHDHGGTCHICGAAAMYVAKFHHRPSNTYIVTGEDCAENMHMGDPAAFRRFRANVGELREAAAGKRKAAQTLADLGHGNVWTIYEAVQVKRAAYTTDDEGIDQVKVSDNEWTLIDIVGKLIKYGSISDKQIAFLASLAARIERNEPSRKEVWAAERAAEAAAAAPVPVTDKRITVEGKVLTIRQPDEDAPFPTVKILVQHETGWKVWGSLPSSLDNVEVGTKIRFDAKVKVSDKDTKFGFYSRPTKAEVVA